MLNPRLALRSRIVLMPTTARRILALDVGNRRVGLALASTEARLSSPLTTLEQGDNLLDELAEIIKTEQISDLVVGWPRNLSGDPTEQTEIVKAFAELLSRFDLPVYFQDETLTSVKAQKELESRGKDYKKSDIDALAATYILEDWLSEHKGEL